MHWNIRKSRSAVVITTFVVAMIVWSIDSATAHGGDAHTQEGNNFDGILQVAGTAAALGIAYLLVSRVFRYREEARGNADSGHDDPAV